jgi:hypothetical protein
MKSILVLSLLVALSICSKPQLTLSLDENKELLIEPYKLYEVQVPLSTLAPS